MKNKQGPAASLAQKLLAMDRLDLALRLSALLLILHIFRHGSHADILGRTIMLCGLVYLPLLRTPWPWALSGSVLFWKITRDAFALDNHIYLVSYWCLALTLCMTAKEEKKLDYVKLNARLLFGLCMLFAVIWKAVSPSYMDNSFFHFLMLSDNRFHDFARLLGGLTPEIIDHNYRVFSNVQSQTLSLDGLEPAIQSSPGLRPLGLFLTWWTILIESILAMAFLLPDKKAVNVIRHSTLLIFAVSTYMIAPVLGFGITLLIFGMLNCPESWHRTRLLYLVVIVLIELAKLQPVRWFL